MLARMGQARGRYVRFVLGHDHPDSGARAGLFTIAYALKRNQATPAYQVARLAAVLDWFNDNLDRPKRFSRSTSKAAAWRATRGVSWFKASACEHIAKMHEMAEIIEDLGHYTDVVKCARPGFIVYEDEFQIVTELFTDAAIR
jgi:hypothetical protein